MANDSSSYTRSASARWEWKLVRVRTGPAPAGDSPSVAKVARGLSRRERQSPLLINVRYRGGPEASYWIEFRGGGWRFPGHASLHDVMEVINGGARVR